MNEKYQKYRDYIKTGDVILFHSKSGITSSIIKWADDCYYTHTGIAFWVMDRLFIIDAWLNGVEIVPMSRRMKIYDDWIIIRKKAIDTKLLKLAETNVLNKVYIDEPYGFSGLGKRLFKLKFNWLLNTFNIKIKPNKYPVCSDVTKYFLCDLGVKCYDDLSMPSVQDLLRYSDDSLEIIRY